MSSRVNYAHAAAVLVDWIATMEGEDQAIDFLAAHIADNGSIPEFCQQQGLMWGVLAAWIRKDEERNKRYQQALADRGAMRKEHLLDGWWQTAKEVPESAVTHGDVHKAREALAKAEGVFESGKAGITVTPGDGTPKSITVTFVDAAEGRPA